MSEHFDETSHGALVSSLGEQVVGMLLVKFLAQMEERFAILETTLAADTPDMAVVKQQAHDMTSSSGSVGLGLMCKTATACEIACKEGNTEEALRQARLLVDMAPAVKQAVQQAYPSI